MLRWVEDAENDLGELRGPRWKQKAIKINEDVS
jgi:hypothetical protein